jgi:hypothetical protein
MGNGAALTSLNASNLTSGTVADARLTTNVALLDHSQKYTGNNTYTGSNTNTGNNQFNGANNFTNMGNNFTGSFFGNGLVGWTIVPGNSVQAAIDTGYLLTSSQLTTVMLPLSPNVKDIVRISGAGIGGWQVAGNPGQSIIGNFASYLNIFLQPGSSSADWDSLASSADGTRMYAGGNLNGGVQFSLDSGHTWNPTTLAGSGWRSMACSANGNTVFAAPSGGNIQWSTDGGQTWTPIATSANWTAIACSANGGYVIAGASSGNLVLTSGTSPASGSWTTVACSSNGTNLAAAIGTTVYTSINGGASWTHNSLAGSCSALVAASTGLKLVAAYNGGIATSTNFGGNWTISSAGSKTWNCLAGSSDCTRLVAGVSGGSFYASANFGATWTPLTSTNQFWSGAAMSADGTKFAGSVQTVGSVNGGIFYSATSTQTTSTTNSIVGSQGSAVELQYIGNGQFMPVSSSGLLWAN